ncbi:MipA/OmpV family protein [Sulfitobacter sp. SK012]|uniref:MipA/OmpV family protein n=1 Tax=Sulfitobacter sp. SK012 TaxID=1389005 RepID=UPI000E0B0DB8|nr:MipA/OmpV family protein [Sulfitobacter sp. SK012]AXI45402.1 MipA/OmpV family protein [Sulfitobacter sp. SK012]
MRAFPKFSTTLALSVACAFGAALPGAAQERSFNFALGAGVSNEPAYPGADSNRTRPDFAFTFGAVEWGPIEQGSRIGSIPSNGLALRGSFRIVGSRDSGDNSELAGLKDIDTAVELGLGAVYRGDNVRVFGGVRQGFGGHEGVTGTLGADVIFRPGSKWTISAGPRINFGNSEYASTYFGISQEESAASQFGAYEAEGGVLGAGFSVIAAYQLDQRWAVGGQIGYERLLNDAGNSPITQLGSNDQWTLRLGLSRSFDLQF